MSLQQKNEGIDVVGIDYPCLDYVIAVDRLPGTNDEIDIKDETWQGGGMVPTALAALGRLGVRSGLIGVVGDDLYGKYCVEDLKRHSVDTRHLIVDRGRKTDFCISAAEQSTRGRSFFTRWGNCRRLTRDDLDREYIGQAKYLHLCMEMNDINETAAKIAKDMGTKVVIDADHYSDKTEKNMDLIDVFVASEKYYRTRFPDGSEEENCRQILNRGPSVVIFTLGDKGCIGIGDRGFFRLDAFHLSGIADTTGAGDVFHGAFIKALLDGKDIKQCAEFASAVAAIKCMRLGGRAGIPDQETTEHFLETGEILPCDFDEREKMYRAGLEMLIEGR